MATGTLLALAVLDDEEELKLLAGETFCDGEARALLRMPPDTSGDCLAGDSVARCSHGGLEAAAAAAVADAECA